MKKILLLIVLVVFIVSATFATVSPKKSKLKVSKKILGRECCTRSGPWGENGATITVEACAGWFLSNSQDAMARACEKAVSGLAGAQQ